MLFSELPEELVLEIAKSLSAKDIVSLGMVDRDLIAILNRKRRFTSNIVRISSYSGCVRIDGEIFKYKKEDKFRYNEECFYESYYQFEGSQDFSPECVEFFPGEPRIYNEDLKPDRRNCFQLHSSNGLLEAEESIINCLRMCTSLKELELRFFNESYFDSYRELEFGDELAIAMPTVTKSLKICGPVILNMTAEAFTSFCSKANNIEFEEVVLAEHLLKDEILLPLLPRISSLYLLKSLKQTETTSSLTDILLSEYKRQISPIAAPKFIFKYIRTNFSVGEMKDIMTMAKQFEKDWNERHYWDSFDSESCIPRQTSEMWNFGIIPKTQLNAAKDLIGHFGSVYKKYVFDCDERYLTYEVNRHCKFSVNLIQPVDTSDNSKQNAEFVAKNQQENNTSVGRLVSDLEQLISSNNDKFSKVRIESLSNKYVFIQYGNQENFEFNYLKKGACHQVCKKFFEAVPELENLELIDCDVEDWFIDTIIPANIGTVKMTNCTLYLSAAGLVNVTQLAVLENVQVDCSMLIDDINTNKYGGLSRLIRDLEEHFSNEVYVIWNLRIICLSNTGVTINCQNLTDTIFRNLNIQTLHQVFKKFFETVPELKNLELIDCDVEDWFIDTIIPDNTGNVKITKCKLYLSANQLLIVTKLAVLEDVKIDGRMLTDEVVVNIINKSQSVRLEIPGDMEPSHTNLTDGLLRHIEKLEKEIHDFSLKGFVTNFTICEIIRLVVDRVTRHILPKNRDHYRNNTWNFGIVKNDQQKEVTKWRTTLTSICHCHSHLDDEIRQHSIEFDLWLKESTDNYTNCREYQIWGFLMDHSPKSSKQLLAKFKIQNEVMPSELLSNLTEELCIT